MLPGQMSLLHLASILDAPRNLSLKFGQNHTLNSLDLNVVFKIQNTDFYD